MEDEKVETRITYDGWVVIDHTQRGFEPIRQTLARTRKGAIALYDAGGGSWVTGGSFATDKKNGYVDCVHAALTLEQPKSKSRARTP